MSPSLLLPRRRAMWGALMIAAASPLLLAGCGGGSALPPAQLNPAAPQRPAWDVPNYHAPDQWIEMIAQAGLSRYAALGSDLVSQGRVRLVAPPTLDANYNAFAWLDSGEIWINRPMFERYPDVLDQATIFLHELIHIDSTEQTHLGPWWSAQSEFRAYFATRSQTTAALASAAAPVRESGEAPCEAPLTRRRDGS